MNAKKYFYITLILSVIVQIITGIMEIIILFIKVDSPYKIIKQLLVLEVSVQFIEGLFYLWLVYHFSKVTNVTPKRYFDWFITTPTMLVSLTIYLIYLGYKDKKMDTSKLDLYNLLLENSTNLSYILCLNWLMLLFGYLGEMKIISTLYGVVLGFVPFLIYYYIIYINYAIQSERGFKIFLYFVFFWSLYGFVALLPYYAKNTCYNILDLFAKNFFGIFLSYTIISKNY